MKSERYYSGFVGRCMSAGLNKSAADALLRRSLLVKSSAGFLGVSSFADKVNFAANVKSLADLSNRELNKALGKDELPEESVVVMTPPKKKRVKAVVSVSPEIEEKLTDEQRKKLDAIVKRINRDRNK